MNRPRLISAVSRTKNGVEGNVSSHLGVPGLLFGIDMPYNIVRQSNNLVARSFSHFGKALGFGLVLESVTREVDAW
jgi:hypothetical protein